MNSTQFQLDRAPIIEAVLDIDCDLPPTLDWNHLNNAARKAFREGYPEDAEVSQFRKESMRTFLDSLFVHARGVHPGLTTELVVT